MNERLIALLLDSFPKILLPGLTMTIPLTVISFSHGAWSSRPPYCAGSVCAMSASLRRSPAFTSGSIRGTPLLVQLFVVFYGLPDVGILLDPFPAAVLVFADQRGRVLRRDDARRAGVSASRADRGGLLRRHALPADHPPHSAAAGAAHRVPAAVQLADMPWSRTRRWPRTSPSWRCSWRRSASRRARMRCCRCTARSR